MKFSCNTVDILQALQLVNRAISSQQALPILGNILFRAEGSNCTVSATDLELSIVTHFPADIEREGSITIPAKAILNFAQYNTDSNIVLEAVEGTQLRCTSAHSKTVLSGELATEYPTITPVEKKSSFTLDAASLLEALNLVTFSSARSPLRPVLSGVYLRIESGRFILVATDSYRLSEFIMDAGAPEDVSCIIPVKVLEELKMILAADKPPKRTVTEEAAKEGTRKEAMPIEITLGAQQIEARAGSAHLLSRLIDGKFPDYCQIIPKEHACTAIFSVRELTAAVKRMHYFAREVNNNLTFTLEASQAHIATPQTQLGKDETTIPIELTGAPRKIALSSSYLLDFLSHIESDVVQMEVADGQHPAVFRVPTNTKFLHLVMPLRMQES